MPGTPKEISQLDQAASLLARWKFALEGTGNRNLRDAKQNVSNARKQTLQGRLITEHHQLKTLQLERFELGIDFLIEVA